MGTSQHRTSTHGGFGNGVASGADNNCGVQNGRTVGHASGHYKTIERYVRGRGEIFRNLSAYRRDCLFAATPERNVTGMWV